MVPFSGRPYRVILETTNDDDEGKTHVLRRLCTVAVILTLGLGLAGCGSGTSGGAASMVKTPDLTQIAKNPNGPRHAGEAGNALLLATELLRLDTNPFVFPFVPPEPEPEQNQQPDGGMIPANDAGAAQPPAEQKAEEEAKEKAPKPELQGIVDHPSMPMALIKAGAQSWMVKAGQKFSVADGGTYQVLSIKHQEVTIKNPEGKKEVLGLPDLVGYRPNGNTGDGASADSKSGGSNMDTLLKNISDDSKSGSGDSTSNLLNILNSLTGKKE